MKISRREVVLAWVTAVVVVAGLTYAFCEPRIKEYRQVMAEQQEMLKRTQLDERLGAQKSVWQTRVNEISMGLPLVPTNKDVTADMLITMEGIAKAHGINLLRREAEREQKHGDIYELAINCTWEGSLESLVSFLLELQKQGAMLDLTQLSVKPEKGLLKGGFVVSCAYRKDVKGHSAEDSSGKTRKAKP